MAKFKLPGFRQWLETVSEETARAGAQEIVNDLKARGPYWTGWFEEQWEVRGGDTRIPADAENPLTPEEAWEGWSNGSLPLSRRITPVDIPTGHTQFTIGNRAKYRAAAMDLVPGRYEVDKNNTARRNWYALYTMGGGMVKALERATGIASRSPKVKGFNGRR